MIFVLDEAILEAASKTLGDAVTGSEINEIFAGIQVIDTSEDSTKWRRFRRTFLDHQRATSARTNLASSWKALPHRHAGVAGGRDTQISATV